MGTEFARSKLHDLAMQKSMAFHIEQKLLQRIHALLYSPDPLDTEYERWEQALERLEMSLRQRMALHAGGRAVVVPESPGNEKRTDGAEDEEIAVVHATPSSGDQANSVDSQFAVRKRPLERIEGSNSLPCGSDPGRKRPLGSASSRRPLAMSSSQE